MRRTPRSVAHGLDIAGTVGSLLEYWLTIVPLVRSEARAWREAAGRIPDSALREHALTTLMEEAMNPEAAAVFATLAPRRRRLHAVRAMVAFQVLTDYVDTLSEQEHDDPLATSLHLHRSLLCAVDDRAFLRDLHPSWMSADGGYVRDLIEVCGQALDALPAADAVRPLAIEAARRCGEGQSHTHAARRRGTEAFEAWAARFGEGSGYEWWEVAAGASSSVAVHALIAAAADERTTAAEARTIDGAYFPSIGALTVLLDSFADRATDEAVGDHNYLRYYPDATTAGERLAVIVREATDAVRGVRRRQRRHAAILAGVVAFYLSARSTEAPELRSIRDRVLASLDGSVPLILATMRIRRRNGVGQLRAAARLMRRRG